MVMLITIRRAEHHRADKLYRLLILLYLRSNCCSRTHHNKGLKTRKELMS
jgi:hypothetical protein